MSPSWPQTSPVGIYRLVDRHSLDTIAESASAAAIWLAAVDLESARSKADAMAALQAGLGLSSSFGHNWDALDEVLADIDLDNHAGAMILLDHSTDFARQCPGEWATLIDVATTAVERWTEWGKPFSVVARGEQEPLGLPALDLFTA